MTRSRPVGEHPPLVRHIGVATDLLTLVPTLAWATAAWADVCEGVGAKVAAGVKRVDGVKPVDGVIVRSTTRVNDAWLAANPAVRWVASATSGTDHLDRESMERHGVVWSAAPGCNAEAVADWVTLALERLESVASAGGQAHDWFPSAGGDSAPRLAVIGVGHVGTAVCSRAQALGWKVVAFDPPRAERDSSFISASWADVLAADVATLHVPLDDSTRYMVDAPAFAGSRWKALLNAARGGVVDETAAQQWGRDGGFLALDVFEGEPAPSPATLAACTIATPHIAGHTLAAKIAGISQCVQWLAQGRETGAIRPGTPASTLPQARPAILAADRLLRGGGDFRQARKGALRQELR